MPTYRVKKLPNIHPGEVLEQEFLEPLKISRYRLAKATRVSATRISEICDGKRAITADTALRLAKFLGTSAKFWLGLQEDYDLELQEQNKTRELAAIVPYSYAQTG